MEFRDFLFRGTAGIPSEITICSVCSVFRGIIIFNSQPYYSSAEGFRREFREFASILFNGTEFRVVFSSAEGFGTEFRDFLFRGTAGIPSEITICSVCSVFRGIIFLSEIPNPSEEEQNKKDLSYTSL